jgi:hypothetical protein
VAIEPREPEKPRCDLPDDDVSGKVTCRYSPGAENLRLKNLKRIGLFHYITKSWQDFEVKMVRGDGNSADADKKKTAPYFLDMQECVPSYPDLCKECLRLGLLLESSCHVAVTIIACMPSICRICVRIGHMHYNHGW